MNVKQKVATIVLGIFVVLSSVLFLAPSVMAADSCANIPTSIIHCDQTGSGPIEDSGVWGVLLVAINILTAGIGIVAIGGVIYASIMYASAGGNAEQTKKAMGIISNIVIGVLAYALMYAGLNFLVPGGVFN